MKKIAVFFYGIFVFLLFSGGANATLITIGTANYDSDNDGTVETYNLIYDANSPFGPITWLDYANPVNTWENQMAWAAGLNGVLTYNTPGYTVDFGANRWRLPSTVDAPYVYGWTGNTTVGYNITSSELGHLFYTELGNLGYYSTSGIGDLSLMGLKKTGDFDNLVNSFYWSGTEVSADPTFAWFFRMYDGSQGNGHDKDNSYYGLAVISGQVSTVPEPATMLLFGTGLLGLSGVLRTKK